MAQTKNETLRQVERAKACAKSLADLYFNAHFSLCLLRPIAYSKDVLEFYNQQGKGMAMGYVRMLILKSLLLQLASVVTDEDKKVASLPNLKRMLEKKDVQAELRKKFSEPTPTVWISVDDPAEIARMEEATREPERKRLEAAFDNKLEDLLRNIEGLKNEELVASAKAMRDKVLAHYELGVKSGKPALLEIGDLGMKWGDERRLLELIEPLLFGAIKLVLNTGYAIAEFKERNEEASDGFWRSVFSKNAHWDWVLETDEERQAVFSLEVAVEQLRKVNENPHRWEWVVIALHNALQGFMVLALGKSNFLVVMRDSTAQKFEAARRDDSLEYPETDLKSLLRLYGMIQTPLACPFVHSKPFVPTGTQSDSVDKLNYSRNNFIHFVPAGAAYGLLEYPQMIGDVVGVISFIVKESGSFFWNDSGQKQRTLALLAEAEGSVRAIEEDAKTFVRERTNQGSEAHVPEEETT